MSMSSCRQQVQTPAAIVYDLQLHFVAHNLLCLCAILLMKFMEISVSQDAS